MLTGGTVIAFVVVASGVTSAAPTSGIPAPERKSLFGSAPSDDSSLMGSGSTLKTVIASAEANYNGCTNGCSAMGRGKTDTCDDGGPGADSAECSYGTDCHSGEPGSDTDCGQRSMVDIVGDPISKSLEIKCADMDVDVAKESFDSFLGSGTNSLVIIGWALAPANSAFKNMLHRKFYGLFYDYTGVLHSDSTHGLLYPDDERLEYLQCTQSPTTYAAGFVFLDGVYQGTTTALLDKWGSLDGSEGLMLAQTLFNHQGVKTRSNYPCKEYPEAFEGIVDQCLDPMANGNFADTIMHNQTVWTGSFEPKCSHPCCNDMFVACTGKAVNPCYKCDSFEWGTSTKKTFTSKGYPFDASYNSGVPLTQNANRPTHCVPGDSGKKYVTQTLVLREHLGMDTMQVEAETRTPKEYKNDGQRLWEQWDYQDEDECYTAAMDDTLVAKCMVETPAACPKDGNYTYDYGEDSKAVRSILCGPSYSVCMV